MKRIMNHEGHEKVFATEGTEKIKFERDNNVETVGR